MAAGEGAEVHDDDDWHHQDCGAEQEEASPHLPWHRGVRPAEGDGEGEGEGCRGAKVNWVGIKTKTADLQSNPTNLT